MTAEEKACERRIYNKLYQNTKRWTEEDRRASGIKGPNRPERLEEIRKKYADGVPDEAVDEFVEKIMKEIYR